MGHESESISRDKGKVLSWEEIGLMMSNDRGI